jgi:hypothetical protein
MQAEIFFSSTYSVGSRSINFDCLDPQTLNVVGYPLCTKVHACMIVMGTFSNPAELRSSSVKEIKRWGFPAQQETRTSLSLINGRTSPLRDKFRQVPKFAFNLTAEICETPPEIQKVLADLLQGSPKVCRPRASAQSRGENLQPMENQSGKPKQRLKLKV